MEKEILDSLTKVQSHVSKLRKTNTRFIYVSLIASVMATLIAGLTAFTGPIVGQGAPAWKWTCGVVAIFTATATVFTGLHKQLTISERLAKATECAGKIKSLRISLENSDANKEEILKEYRKIIEVYNEYLV
ncbi:MAG: hypothetical protein M3R36_15395 [Bacteroidota bacterium]|nr:hypothetical protein [Bacteroidota bacterium]